MDKKNFEKDINVPSKNIEYHNDAKDCEQCNPDSVCCYCKNIACYQLEETIDGLLKIQYQLADNNKKLRQTLTEIKEIAESEIDSKEFMAIQCMLNGSVDNKNKVLKQILQKISEREGNDD